MFREAMMSDVGGRTDVGNLFHARSDRDGTGPDNPKDMPLELTRP